MFNNNINSILKQNKKKQIKIINLFFLLINKLEYSIIDLNEGVVSIEICNEVNILIVYIWLCFK
jgi:hypothetical protein